MTDIPQVTHRVIYQCEGCGAAVGEFGRDEAPWSRFCSICAWCDQFIEPREIIEVRRHLEPGGWTPEPRHTRRLPCPRPI